MATLWSFVTNPSTIWSFVVLNAMAVMFVVVVWFDAIACLLYMYKSTKEKAYDGFYAVMKKFHKGEITEKAVTPEAVISAVRQEHVNRMLQSLLVCAAVVATGFGIYRNVISAARTVAGSRLNSYVVREVGNVLESVATCPFVDASSGRPLDNHPLFDRLIAVYAACTTSTTVDDVNDEWFAVCVKRSCQSVTSMTYDSKVPNALDEKLASDMSESLYAFDPATETFYFVESDLVRSYLSAPRSRSDEKASFVTSVFVGVAAACVIVFGVFSMYMTTRRINSLFKGGKFDHHASKAYQLILLEEKVVVPESGKRRFVLPSGPDAPEESKQERKLASIVAFADQQRAREEGHKPSTNSRKAAEWLALAANPDAVLDMSDFGEEAAQLAVLQSTISPAALKAAAAVTKSPAVAVPAVVFGAAEVATIVREALAANDKVVKGPSVKKEESVVKRPARKARVARESNVGAFVAQAPPTKVVRESAQTTSVTLGSKIVGCIHSLSFVISGIERTVTSYVRQPNVRQCVTAPATHVQVPVGCSATLYVGEQKFALSCVRSWTYTVAPNVVDFGADFECSVNIPSKSLVLKPRAINVGTYVGMVYSTTRGSISSGNVEVTDSSMWTHRITTGDGDSGSFVWISSVANGQSVTAPCGVHIGHAGGVNVCAPLSVVFGDCPF
jgi:hypothetical protein